MDHRLGAERGLRARPRDISATSGLNEASALAAARLCWKERRSAMAATVSKPAVATPSTRNDDISGLQ